MSTIDENNRTIAKIKEEYFNNPKTNEVYCPHCKSTSYVRLHPRGSEYAALVIHEIGSVYPNVCLNCGTVYLDRHYLETIRKEKERKQKIMKW